MYQIKCDENVIFDPRYKDLVLINPKVRLEVNTVGEGSFVIYNTHPNYANLKKMKSIFEVSDEAGVIFRGRMTKDTKDFHNAKAVDLEGLMAFFNDSVIRPFNFPDDFLEVEEYITAAASGNVIEFFLKWLIDQHNSQVQEFQQFKLGDVTVTDPNNYLSRSLEKITKTWEVLKSRLFESALGGYLCIRYEEDGNYIDYLSDFQLTNTQKITYGENLLDLSTESDAGETCSAIIPLGAEIEVPIDGEAAAVDETEEDTSTQTKKVRLTIEDLPDGDITDDIAKIGDILYSKSSVDDYGWIVAPVDMTTWEDVTEASHLQNKGIEWLSGTGRKLTSTVNIKAVDLHFTDKEIASFRIYRYVQTESSVHGHQERYRLTAIELDLQNPQSTVITLGDSEKTLTDINASNNSDFIHKIEVVVKDTKEHISDVSTEIKNIIIENSTTMINTCTEILMSALSSYTEESTFGEFKESVETALQLQADNLTVKVSEMVSEINKVNGDLQQKFNQITKYFTFDINGLTIGQVDNPNKVVIDNDEISILVNETVVQKFDAQGKALIPELNVTREFDLFGYVISQDEDNRVNCDYVG